MKTVIAIALLALIAAAPAHADESSYVTTIYSHGEEVKPTTLALGYQICYDISRNGVQGLENESAAASTAGTSDHRFAVIIVAAVEELCPSNLPAMHAWITSHD